jgi:hypothetical protein
VKLEMVLAPSDVHREIEYVKRLLEWLQRYHAHLASRAHSGPAA